MQKHSQKEGNRSPVNFDLAAAAHAALGSNMVRSYCTMMALIILPLTLSIFLVAPYAFDVDSASNKYIFLSTLLLIFFIVLCGVFIGLAWVSVRLPPLYSRILFTLAAIGSGTLTTKHLFAIFTSNGVSLTTDIIELPWLLLLAAIFAELTLLATLVAISPIQRLRVIRDLPWNVRRLFDRLIGAPSALSQMAKGSAGIRSRYLLGTLALTIVIGSLMQLHNVTMTVEQHDTLVKICSRGDPIRHRECLSDIGSVHEREMVSLTIMTVILPMLLLICISFSRIMIRGAQKRVLQSAAEAPIDKHRPTILFLRAFDDDQVSLPAGLWTPARWLFSLRRINAPLDHLLVEEFSDYGRITALGKGNKNFPQFGAVREYCQLANWKETVVERAEHAAAIVMCIADDDLDREGIRTELDILEDKALRVKTLFMVRPRAANKEANQIAWSMTGLQAPDSDERYLCSFTDLNGERQWGQAKAFNQMEYLVALKWFFYSRFGEK